MAWLTPITFVSTDAVTHTVMNNIGLDLRTKGGDVDYAGYKITNLAQIHGASNILKLFTNSLERLRVHSDGKIGINVVGAPSNMLHIKSLSASDEVYMLLDSNGASSAYLGNQANGLALGSSNIITFNIGTTPADGAAPSGLVGQINSTGLDMVGAISARPSQVTAANGANHNVDITIKTFVRVAGPTAAYSISGFTGGADGRILLLFNAVAQQLTLKNGDAGSTAGNRIFTNTGADIVLRTGNSFALLIYDTGISSWVVMATN